MWGGDIFNNNNNNNNFTVEGIRVLKGRFLTKVVHGVKCQMPPKIVLRIEGSA